MTTRRGAGLQSASWCEID